MKLIIDADIGDNIDDAFALLLAMDMQAELIGVTTVFGNTAERARMAKKLMRDFGGGYENVPVYAGYGTRTEEHLCQYTPEIDRDLYTPDSENPCDAVNFIIDSARKFGDEITLLFIGPLTNLAKVIEKDPEALSRVNKTVIMGGAYFKQYADWNVSCDPESAKTVYDKCPNLYCLGADVTHMLDVDEEAEALIGGYRGENPAVKYLSHLFRLWRVAHPDRHAVLHDPLLVYYAYHPEVCLMEKATVAVITEGYARGMTMNVEAYGNTELNPAYENFDMSRKVTVARSVDRDKVVDRFIECFK